MQISTFVTKISINIKGGPSYLRSLDLIYTGGHMASFGVVLLLVLHHTIYNYADRGLDLRWGGADFPFKAVSRGTDV